MDNLYDNLEQNISFLENIFKNNGDVVSRKFPIGNGLHNFAYSIYIDGLADRRIIEERILPQIMASSLKSPEGFFFKPMGLLEYLKEGGFQTTDLREEKKWDAILRAILSGDTAVFVSNSESALLIASKGFANRGVFGADIEVSVAGSNEAFTESIRTNTALIRRRIKDKDLKIEQKVVGRRSQTDIAICYINSIARDSLVNEAKKRLENIDIDAIADIGQLEELISDDYQSPYPLCQITQRPDKTAASLMEGRIAIIADNSPQILIIPATINTMFQATDDYYQKWDIMSITRILRFVAAFISVTLPGLYIAITIFHPSMLPTVMMLKMAAARADIPIPAVLEILIMEFAFELLREAGIRLPRAIGSSIGIIGGLIVGDAAVSAGIVSPIVVIIVALTGISSFVIPSYSLVSAFRISKIFVLILSAALGIFGFWIAIITILIHLCNLKSFGIPYLFPFVSTDLNNYNDIKDSLFRLPIKMQNFRPIFAKPSQKIRSKENNINIKE